MSNNEKDCLDECLHEGIPGARNTCRRLETNRRVYFRQSVV